MLGQILLTFITILVGVNLVPTIANTAYGAWHNSTGGLSGVNVTGVNATLIDLVPLFFILSVAITSISSTLQILDKMNF